jgi:hypothetical protein
MPDNSFFETQVDHFLMLLEELGIQSANTDSIPDMQIIRAFCTRMGMKGILVYV